MTTAATRLAIIQESNDKIDMSVILAVKSVPQGSSLNAALRHIKDKTGLTATEIVASLTRIMERQ